MATAQNLRYGAERERLYIPELRGARVAVLAHAASVAVQAPTGAALKLVPSLLLCIRR